MNIIVSLVGLNPIPNYISILNYCKNNKSKIFLVYTGEGNSISSLNIANNIKKVVKNKFKDISVEMFESSKSDFSKINECINKIQQQINNIIDKSNDHKINIILDITGSTKPNSALFYSAFNKVYECDNRVNLKECYVSYQDNKIYESRQEDKGYNLSKLSKELHVEKEEILNLHGYEDYKKNNRNVGIINNIFLQDFTLIFCVKSEREHFSKLKEDMFIALDVAEKLGGTLSKIFFETKSFINSGRKCKDKLDGFLDESIHQNEFIEMFENGTNRFYKKRIILKSQDGTYNNKEFKTFIEGVK